MNQQEIEVKLQEIKSSMLPPNATLEIVSLEGNKLKLKVTGIAEDIFKIQGKIVNSGDETKKIIIAKLKEAFNKLEVSL